MADADRCIVCGEIVPEGRMVCPNCEKSAIPSNKTTNSTVLTHSIKAILKGIIYYTIITTYIILLWIGAQYVAYGTIDFNEIDIMVAMLFGSLVFHELFQFTYERKESDINAFTDNPKSPANAETK